MEIENLSDSNSNDILRHPAEEDSDSSLAVEVIRIDNGLPLPTYQTKDAAGMDLFAAIEKELVIQCGGRVVIPTGVRVAIPRGFEMQIRPRSGLAANYGISICNTPGTIDADYRGEVGVILVNHGDTDFVVKRGDRVAQAVFNRIHQAKLVEVNELDTTARSTGGYGSTG